MQAGEPAHVRSTDALLVVQIALRTGSPHLPEVLPHRSQITQLVFKLVFDRMDVVIFV